ncbi:pX [Bat adenovirus 2]|uniref:PX n=1 Tax=Bat adenovirus 2 TaxID=696069 RepID=G1FQM6_9ADEN|nr:pX [Bat adenovirus 2]AEM06273.1 pX [Bat adenovirus 2]QDA77083.1 pX [Bat mastadenovirus B]
MCATTRLSGFSAEPNLCVLLCARMAGRNVTLRLRVPVRTRLTGAGRHRRTRRTRSMRCGRMTGGFLPALIPLIAAAIGAVPGIASVALQAARH